MTGVSNPWRPIWPVDSEDRMRRSSLMPFLAVGLLAVGACDGTQDGTDGGRATSAAGDWGAVISGIAYEEATQALSVARRRRGGAGLPFAGPEG
jgi:hypothetical protein